MSLKKMLVVADRDDKKSVGLSRAMELAAKSKASIEIVGFVHVSDAEMSTMFGEAKLDEIRAKLVEQKKQAIQKVLDAHSAKATIQVVWEKNIHDWILDVSSKGDYDLIVKTGNRSESLFYTPTDWNLLRRSQTPLMVVASSKWKKKSVVPACLDLGSKKKKQQALFANRYIVGTRIMKNISDAGMNK